MSELRVTSADRPAYAALRGVRGVRGGGMTALAAAAPVPSVLAGKYVLGDVLGAGGMGTVYLALQPALDRLVAVKVMHPELVGDQRIADHFRREALATAQLAHPNLAAVIDVGETDDGCPFLVMEYVPGRPLSELVRGRAQPIARVLEIAAQILSALAEAHDADVVHADVKTDNVLIETTVVGIDRIRLVDFGLARIGAGPCSVDLVAARYVAGTPEYMAPEVIEGGLPTPASDLYGVGVILYELLTGSTPFGSGSPADVLARQRAGAVVPPSLRRPGHDVPRALEEIVLRALAPAPADRFTDADDFAAALAGVARRLAVVRWCAACGAAITPGAAICAACGRARAHVVAPLPADVDTAVWRAPRRPCDPRDEAEGRERALRDAIGRAIRAGAVDELVEAYLALAALLADRGDVHAAGQELQEGVDILTAGDAGSTQLDRPLHRLRVALADLSPARETLPHDVR